MFGRARLSREFDLKNVAKLSGLKKDATGKKKGKNANEKILKSYKSTFQQFYFSAVFFALFPPP